MICSDYYPQDLIYFGYIDYFDITVLLFRRNLTSIIKTSLFEIARLDKYNRVHYRKENFWCNLPIEHIKETEEHD